MAAKKLISLKTYKLKKRFGFIKIIDIRNYESQGFTTKRRNYIRNIHTVLVLAVFPRGDLQLSNLCRFPNYFLGYFVDLIAMVLMLIAGVASLRNKSRSAAGWLAGAWGFVACLNYRAFAWRYYEWRDTGQVSNEPVIGLFVLAGLLFLSFSSFVYALYLARPR